MDDHFAPDEEVMRQLEALGAPPEIIAKAAQRRARVECLIHDDCWLSVQTFISLAGQWRVVSTMSGVLWMGIDFQSIEPCLRLRGVAKKLWQQVFADLELMQVEAVGIMNKRNSA